MPRKIQPIQVVTYRKKIVYWKPENESNNFFDTFTGLFLINILAIILSISTAGVGTSIAAELGLSQFGQALTSTTIQTLINFSTTTIFDAAANRLTPQNLLYNFLFAITDIGKIGRGLKQDKLIKILNDTNLLKQIGFNDRIKNFYQLQEFLKMKDVILKDKTKIIFKNAVSDAELLQAVFLVADSTLKKEIKKLSYDQLKSLVQIEHVIYKINPNLIARAKKLNLKRIDMILANELNLKLNDFLKLNDLEAVNALVKLQSTRIGQQTLNSLNLMRMQSKFQRNFFQSFQANWKNLKNQSKKLNPFYWANKLMNEVTLPIDGVLKQIRETSMKFLDKIPKVGRQAIRKYNLIPCQPKSFLLGYTFELVTLDGSGYITVYKKPYVWKKEMKISNYNPIRIWTNILEVQQFATSPSQNRFYLNNWSLGWGFKQAQFKALALISPGVAKIMKDVNKFYRQVNKVKVILNAGVWASIKTMSIRKANQLPKQQINRLLGKTIGSLPFAGIFTSSIIKSIRNNKWDYTWVRNDASRATTKLVIKKGRAIKYARKL